MATWVDVLDSASQKYDNTVSELTATNSQAAIDEIVTDLKSIPLGFSSSWIFNSSTATADPGTSKFSLNAATMAATTEIHFNDISQSGLHIPDLLFDELRVGQRILCYQTGKGQEAGLYEVASPAVDNTGWWTVPVTFLETGSGGEFDNGKTIVFDFFGLGGSGIPEAPEDNTTYLRRNGDWINELQNTGSTENVTAALGSFAPDIADGNALYTSATGAITITGITTALQRTSFEWILSHNSQTVGWPASFKFPGGTAPDLSSGNTLLLGGFTRDTGSTWMITYVENYTL